MDRRNFIKGAAATGVGGLIFAGRYAQAAPLATGDGAAMIGRAYPTLTPFDTQSDSASLANTTTVAAFNYDGRGWKIHEDLSRPDAPLIFVTDSGEFVLSMRVEASHNFVKVPYFGMSPARLGHAKSDLLAEYLLRNGGDPKVSEVIDAAPLVGHKLAMNRRKWTSFLGRAEGIDTIQSYPGGDTKTYHPPNSLASHIKAAERSALREGVIGGYMPGVHQVIPLDGNRWVDVLVFPDVDATDQFITHTWHRTALIENGQITDIAYGYTYPPFPPRRKPPTAAAFYRHLLRFASYWQTRLDDMARVKTPDPSWANMARFGMARELVVKPHGFYPKYGAVDRGYYGSEYDGFQDTFTSTFFANIEWGRFEQAKRVFSNYFEQFVYPDGVVNMRGPEIGQYGLMLSLTARYVNYTGDAGPLKTYHEKIGAIAGLLVELHDESLTLASDNPGYGLIHGWSESDSCLGAVPSTWWQPYYSNTAMAIRGFRDLAGVWNQSGAAGAQNHISGWQQRSKRLHNRLIKSMRDNIRHDLNPPYIGPLPGTKLTFDQALAKNLQSRQAWAHRVYSELLEADVLPDDLANLVINCMRGHGGTSLGIVANISPPGDQPRDILGFISYGYAMELLRLDRIEEYLLFLYAHRHHAHTPGSWTAGEVIPLDGEMPLFCLPAQMTIPLLMRWVMVSEDSDAEVLHLARGVAREWWQSGKTVGIESAPTRWGETGFSLQGDSTGIRGDVHLPARSMPETVRLHLRIPPDKKLAGVSVDDRSATIKDNQKPYVDIKGSPGQLLKVVARYA